MGLVKNDEEFATRFTYICEIFTLCSPSVRCVSDREREREYEDETFYSSYSNVCRFGYVSECGVETKALNEPYASSPQTYSLCRRMVLALALEIYIKMCVRVHICGNTL